MLVDVVFRKQGTLIPLERAILEVGVRNGLDGMYGFSLAQTLAGEKGETRLVSQGTLYKALDRLRKAGLLESEWEDADLASAAGRPRRRIYRITRAGATALAEAAQPGVQGQRWGEALA